MAAIDRDSMSRERHGRVLGRRQIEALTTAVRTALGGRATEVADAILADVGNHVGLARSLADHVAAGRDPEQVLLVAARCGGLLDAAGVVDVATADWILDCADSPARWLTGHVRVHGATAVPAGLLDAPSSTTTGESSRGRLALWASAFGDREI